MFQGTGSDVGKSLIVAGLARLYTRQGLSVRPFKPQNMSNNAAPAVGPGGLWGEIGRAQALQARAARVDLSTDMNPVLLKPQTDIGAQIVLDGRVVGNADARAYHTMKPELLDGVLAAYRRLCKEADLVLVEGAGSPAEVNLRAGDIANMGFAEAADVPVALIGDIERGGVIAALVGTWTLLTESERARIAGYIVNRFRGDVSLFDDAPAVIRERTGMDSLGIVPWLDAARDLPAEDTASLVGRYDGTGWARAAIRIAVPHLPRIANFDDLDPLASETDVALRLVEPGDALPEDADLIVLAGSKSTRDDLAALRDNGWDGDITAAAEWGAHIFGICGGYQMLGRTVDDPGGVEGAPGTTPGLGLLDVATVIGGEKSLMPASCIDCETGAQAHGYEMHMGRSDGADTSRPFVTIGSTHARDGARAPGGRIAGTYVHGLFASDPFRHAFLRRIAPDFRGVSGWESGIELALDRLADHMERHTDTARILEIARRAKE